MLLYSINVRLTVIGILLLLKVFCAPAQEPSPDAQIEYVFQEFFENIADRDTLRLKEVVYHPHASREFMKSFSGNVQHLSGNSTSTLGGFLKTVSDKNGLIGKCQYEFDDMVIKHNGRFAVVTANYTCFHEGVPDNKGLYVLHMLKAESWKIESVSRYAEKVR